ncbi:substrate-binding periplasmic protein [Shewanella acanthi]|uniref:substrate-binding periplasmic protein n=1 Tax=Shewanella acanthi TaxID=2864212 RepID=UPI0021ABD428|nr:transporter substrate-binding domain-containing protein [Shewanella acanthi]
MTKFVYRKFLFVLLVFALEIPFSVTAVTLNPVCPTSIRVGYNDWPPYAWQALDGQLFGLDIELMRDFAEYLGCQVTFIKIPAKRSHQMLKEGTLDMMMGATLTLERQSYALFSRAYREEEIRLFALDKSDSHLELTQWEDIFDQKLRLLVPNSGWFGADYERTQHRLDQAHLLVLSPGPDKSVQMLNHGRADFILGESIAIPYVSQRQGISLIALPMVLAQHDIHLMFSKASMTALQVEQFDLAIDTFRQNGLLEKVLLKWQRFAQSATAEMTQ